MRTKKNGRGRKDRDIPQSSCQALFDKSIFISTTIKEMGTGENGRTGTFYENGSGQTVKSGQENYS